MVRDIFNFHIGPQSLHRMVSALSNSSSVGSSSPEIGSAILAIYLQAKKVTGPSTLFDISGADVIIAAYFSSLGSTRQNSTISIQD